MKLVQLISKRRVVYVLVFVVAGLSFWYHEDEVDLLLKRLNKTPVKTIKSADGDIIDCVHISQQPAFDHPSLKGHSIQRSPSGGGSIDEKKAPLNEGINQTWRMNGGECPEETIPIRRTTRQDILRASSIKSFGNKDRRSRVFHAPSKSEKPDVNQPAHEYAVGYVNGDAYYGAQATMNVWNPKVQQSSEFSLSQIWVLSMGGVDYDTNSLQAGWQVCNLIYGDNKTRLFIYWTTDAYTNTGCYNLQCSGFVQTNKVILLGGTLSPYSTYGGTQYVITILIWKDPQGGNWWLKVGDINVGYWPSTLFTHLNKSANIVEWGGEIVNSATNGHHTTTEMGSGHFPTEGFGKSSYFRNIRTVDGSNTLISATNLKGIVSYPCCYDISIGGMYDANWGSYFFYGGPGGNDVGCP